MPGAAPGERAAEQLAGHGEPVALVAAEGRHGPERRHYAPARIFGGIAVAVEQPAERDLRALVVRDAQLSLRHRARRHVEDERRLSRQRDADAKRIGAEAAVGAPVRRHPRKRDYVHEVDRHEAHGHRHLRPMADASKMVGIAKRGDRQAVGLCPFDRHAGRLEADRLAVTLAAVQSEQRTCIELHLRTLIHRQPAFDERLDVARDHADAVRVVAEQIGGDQVLGDELRFARFAAAGGDDRLYGARERFFFENHSGLMPPRCTTRVQRSTSLLMNLPNSSGVLATTSKPS